MQHSFLASSILLAVTSVPAAAQEFWVKDPQGASCSLNSLNLKLTPFHHGSTMDFDAYANQILFPQESDIALLVKHVPKGKVASLSFVSVHFPNEGVFKDGTSRIRVFIDRALIPEASREPSRNIGSMHLVQWAPLDEKKWLTALFTGKSAKVDFVDDAGTILRSRVINITPIMRAYSLLENIQRWKC